jgi:NAD(P)-dependent dehydrogenase (short-subunit alcohol dehydrogenase family)
MKKPEAVLVTGAARRIGRALSLFLSGRGYAVIGHYHTSAREARSLAKEIRGRGGLFYPLKWNLAAGPEGLMGKCLGFPVRLAGLVNNASVFEKGNLLSLKRKEWSGMLQVNVFSPLTLCAEYYRKAGTGFIINMLDAGAGPFNRDFQIYRMGKRLLAEMTLECARLFAPKVRVNGIAPGAVLPSKFNRGKTAGSVDEVVKACARLIGDPVVTGRILTLK